MCVCLGARARVPASVETSVQIHWSRGPGPGSSRVHPLSLVIRPARVSGSSAGRYRVRFSAVARATPQNNPQRPALSLHKHHSPRRAEPSRPGCIRRPGAVSPRGVALHDSTRRLATSGTVYGRYHLAVWVIYIQPEINSSQSVAFHQYKAHAGVMLCQLIFIDT